MQRLRGHRTSALVGPDKSRSKHDRGRVAMGTKDSVEDWHDVLDNEFVHTRCFTSCISETVYEQLESEMLRGRRAG
ncbi:hypothetical protein [Sorangium sp. So ce204]|uniref:hypothetical protein n=1 Tax=Sorangium sp. So ce204 TaxID=3133288 RepID=UPI003F613630